MPDSASFPITKVNKVKRRHDRGRYDKATVYDILDAAMICHIAYVIDGRPYCTPTAFWREGDHLYWHGSSASQMIKNQRDGVPVCLTATHLDALVQALALARPRTDEKIVGHAAHQLDGAARAPPAHLR